LIRAAGLLPEGPSHGDLWQFGVTFKEEALCS
jgi:hypothetical protein